MHRTPMGPTGAAMEKPMMTPLSSKLKMLCHCLLPVKTVYTSSLKVRKDHITNWYVSQALRFVLGCYAMMNHEVGCLLTISKQFTPYRFDCLHGM